MVSCLLAGGILGIAVLVAGLLYLLGADAAPARQATVVDMIDETQPGYDVTEGVSEQLTVSDTLSDERLDDFLDEGYNP